MAYCFEDTRNPEYVGFSVAELIGQRLLGLILGYEDLNDHDRLRVDPTLALAVGREDILGHDRRQPVDYGKPLAGKIALNRLELSAEPATKSARYHKIAVDMERLERLLVDTFILEHAQPPKEVWLDLDTTDFALHGEQEDRHFNAYYDHYCYTPLYIMCGDKPNARFVVTNLPKAEATAEKLYEEGYCQRALMENHLKDQQLDLFASRMSTQVRASNQLRLMFSTFATVVMRMLRRSALAGTSFATATTNTIRVRLLKIGTVLRVSTRRILLSFATAFPHASIFIDAMRRMTS